MGDIEDIGSDSYRRVDEEHPIDWRYNESDPPTKLVLKTKKKPPEFTETNGVHVVVVPKSLGNYAIVFVLVDPLCADIFNVFCEDVIESSRDINPEDAADFAFERYAKWMHLFKPRSDRKLSSEEIRGLMGELYVLETKFIPEYGPLSSLKSWMNYLKGKQDFIEHDKWYEVKALLEGNDSIHISSLEQLSRDDEGELVVVGLKKTSPESSKASNLNKMYTEVIELLPTFSLKRRFSEIMLSTGFIMGDTYYDEQCYEILGATGYVVKDGFPRLTPDNLPCKGIIRVKYEISLNYIKVFEEERWN